MSLDALLAAANINTVTSQEPGEYSVADVAAATGKARCTVERDLRLAEAAGKLTCRVARPIGGRHPVKCYRPA